MFHAGSTHHGPPARRAAVAALTDTGPREVNEDRMFAAMSDGGAWVIAVADGLGGHTRGDEAAQAAVEGLPERIGSESEMATAFAEANERVLALSAPARGRSFRVSLANLPMSTLCVAAWTPEGGLLIGWMGDTIPFVVRSGPDGFTGYCCGMPHRGLFGSIDICLGMPPEGEWYGGVAEAEIIGDFEDSEMPDVVIIASDGAWEPLAIDYGDAGWLWDDSPAGIGSACDPKARNAADIARSVLERARFLGLNDNATVAVAHWARERGHAVGIDREASTEKRSVIGTDERPGTAAGRTLGIWEGEVRIADDFDKVPREIIDSFYESDLDDYFEGTAA